MESLSTVEKLKQALELEEASDSLTSIPAETYIRLASYAQKLRAATGSGNDDAPGRLAKKQLWLIEVMTKRLLHVRLAKAGNEEAAKHDGDQSTQSARNLLPEERYV